MSVFDEEVLGVTLRFTNPGRGEMVDADRLASHLSLALDTVVRKEVTAGKSLADLRNSIVNVSSAIKELEKQSDSTSARIYRQSQKILSNYTPFRLERMAERAAVSAPTTSGTASLQKALAGIAGKIDRLASVQEKQTKVALSLLRSEKPLIEQQQNRLLSLLDQLPTNEHRVLALIRNGFDQLTHSVSERLGETRTSSMVDQARYGKGLVPAPGSTRDYSDMLVRTIVAAVEGGITARSRRPATSTQYGIKLSGAQAPEQTPGPLGSSAITLGATKGVLLEAIRNISIAARSPQASDYPAVKRYLHIYGQKSGTQEHVQNAIGRNKRSNDDTRIGEDFQVAVARSVNDEYAKRRGTFSGGLSGSEVQKIYNQVNNLGPGLSRRAPQNIASSVLRMLSQRDASPTESYSREQILDFVRKRGTYATSGDVLTAARMANTVGPKDRLFGSLSSIILNGQQEGRAKKQAEREAAEAEIKARRATTPPKASILDEMRKKNPGIIYGSGLGSLQEYYERLEPHLKAGASRLYGFGKSAASRLFARMSAGPSGSGSKDYDELAQGYISRPGSLKGSMRYDTLQQRLQKLSDAFGKATTDFEHYRKVLAGGQISQADRNLAYGSAARTLGLQGSNLSFDQQLQRLSERKARSQLATGLRQQGFANTYESQVAKLASDQLAAEDRYAASQARTRFRYQQWLNKNTEARESEKQAAFAALGSQARLPRVRALRAQLLSNTAGMTDTGDIARAREEFAETLASERFFGKSGPTKDVYGNDTTHEDLRAAYKGRLLQSVQGLTPGQQAQSKIVQSGTAQQRLDSELDKKKEEVEKRRALRQKKYNLDEEKAEADHGSRVDKIRQGVAARAKKVSDAAASIQQKAHDLKVRFLKQEDAGGSAGGGSGRGGELLGGSGGGRDGYGFGLGLAALVGFDSALKELIVDSATYAAKVQTSEFSTIQMAKVSGLSTQAVLAEVEALKQRNLTTQEANSVVQKMMLSQQDLAKSTQLVTVAQNLAALSGADAMETVERLMSGIVTGYTRNLHQLGLPVTMVSAMRQLKSDRAAAGIKGAPTETERREALVNQILQQGARLSGTYEQSLMTAGGQFAYLKKEALEASNVLGKQFLPQFGAVVGLLTHGLQFVQQNADGVATLTRALASLGVAASALGSLQFFKWAFAGLNPWVALAGGALAAGAFVYSNKDKTRYMRENAATATGAIDVNVAALNKDVAARREELAKSPNTESQHQLDLDLTSLKSYAERRKEIEDRLTDDLAKVYLERKKLWDQSVKTTGRQRNTQGLAITALPDMTDARRAEIIARANWMSNLSPGAPPDKIINENARALDRYGSVINDMESKAAAAFDKDFPMSGLDTLTQRYERGTQTPEERLEYEQQRDLYPYQNYGAIRSDLEKRRLTAPDEQRTQIDDLLKRAEDAQANSDEGRKKVLGDYSAGVIKLKNQREAEILQIRAATKAEAIRGSVVSGNYASERKAIEDNFALQKQTIADYYKKRGASVPEGQQAVDVAAEEEKRNQAILALEGKQRENARKRSEADTQYQSELRQREIMGQAGLTTEQAIKQTYDEQVDSIGKIADDEERLNRLREAGISSAEHLKDLAAERASAELDARIEENKRAIDLRLTVGNIAGRRGPGTSEAQEELVSIEATRQATLQSIEDEKKAKLDALNTEEGRRAANISPTGRTRADVEAEIERQARLATGAAETEYVKSQLDALDKQATSTTDKLVSAYGKVLQQKEQEAQLTASSTMEEYNNVQSIYELRVANIQKELALRQNSLDAQHDAEEQMQQAEFDKYSQMLEQRKKQLDDVRGFAEQLFSTLSTDHAKGLRDMLLGSVRNMGARAFGQIAVDAFKGLNMGIGKPTGPLGRIVGAAIPGVFAPSQQALDAQKAAVEDARMKVVATAEDLNTAAVNRLTDALNRAAYSTSTPVPGLIGVGMSGSSLVLPGFSGGGSGGTYANPSFSMPPIFSGSSAANPFIFNATGGGGGGGGTVPSVSSAISYGSPTAGVFGGQSISRSSTLSAGGGAGTFFGRVKAALGIGKAVQLFSKLGLSPSGAGGSIDASFLPLGGVGSGPFGLPVDDSGNIDASSLPLGGTSTNPYAVPNLGNGMTASNYLAGGAMTAAGLYQAISMLGKGKGARGDIFGAGGILGAGAGIAAMIPGGQLVSAGLMAASLVSDLVGSFFEDPKQKRNTQIANYLGANQYMSPAQIAMTSDLQGNMAREGRGGTAFDTGIASTDLQVNAPYMEKVLQPNFTSNPLSYLFGSGKPAAYQQTPQSPYVSADSYSGSQQYQFSEVPGTISYQNLPSNATPGAVNSGGMTLNINAIDSQSIIDRAPDIAAAVQKQMRMGTGIGQSLQAAIFGVG